MVAVFEGGFGSVYSENVGEAACHKETYFSAGMIEKVVTGEVVAEGEQVEVVGWGFLLLHGLESGGYGFQSFGKVICGKGGGEEGGIHVLGGGGSR